VPGAMLGTVPPGPLRSDAQWMRDWLLDPDRTALAIVTLPEEMPITEAIELDQQLRAQVGLAPQALLVNALPPARFSAEETARLHQLQAGPPPVGPAAQAALLQAVRAEAAGREVARLKAALDLPTTYLPLLAAPGWGLPEIRRLVATLASPRPGEPDWVAPGTGAGSSGVAGPQAAARPSGSAS
jgi:hypothetical protein